MHARHAGPDSRLVLGLQGCACRLRSPAPLDMHFSGEPRRDVSEALAMLGRPVARKAAEVWVEKFVPLTRPRIIVLNK